VTTMHTARPATPITTSAGTRPRQLAPLPRRRISHAPGDVPGAALPAAGDLTAQLTQHAAPIQHHSARPTP
jgi:hypothetical protein